MTKGYGFFKSNCSKIDILLSIWWHRFQLQLCHPASWNDLVQNKILFTIDFSLKILKEKNFLCCFRLEYKKVVNYCWNIFGLNLLLQSFIHIIINYKSQSLIYGYLKICEAQFPLSWHVSANTTIYIFFNQWILVDNSRRCNMMSCVFSIILKESMNIYAIECYKNKHNAFHYAKIWGAHEWWGHFNSAKNPKKVNEEFTIKIIGNNVFT